MLTTRPSSSPPKRTKSPVVRIVGSRIYDPKNGKTCHRVELCVFFVSVSTEVCWLNGEVELCVFFVSVSTEDDGFCGDV
ncbi:hypothetical protein HanOQP8_Chr02g0048921 [Helianthus annuus]|nr:hypothetical protein HanOQP8_Chr02g0048921 [Helianthus annuus]